ncbi:MAG: type II secretion system protein GspN [Myxococcota bacterium]|nr:type II secretion system protein GspN [Myxococcota bacterium]
MNHMRLVGAIAGYGLWFIVLYLLLTWLAFPWSKVRDQAIVAASDAGLNLQIDSLDSAFFGVDAKGIWIRPGTADEEPSDKRSTRPPLRKTIASTLLGDGIGIDRLKLKLPASRLIPAGLTVRSTLLGEPISVNTLLSTVGQARLTASIWGGELDLRAEHGEEALRVTLDMEDINLKDYTFKGKYLSANPQGTLRSRGKITWNHDDPKKSSGGVDLFLDDLTIPDLVVLGDVAFSKAEGHVKLSRGRAEIRDTTLEADEVQAVVEGFVTLSKTFSRSRLSLKVRFKVLDELDPLLGAVMGGNTRHKDDQGWYHYQVSGTVAQWRWRPSAASARRSGSRSSGRSSPPSRDSQSDEEEPIERSNDRTPIERPKLNDRDRQDAEQERERLREERTRRREERKARREELMKKRRERQAEIGQKGADGRRGGSVNDEEIWGIPVDEPYAPPGANQDSDELDEDQLEDEEDPLQDEDQGGDEEDFDEPLHED